MTNRRGVNLAASVRQRLRNLADAGGEDLQFVFLRYAVERLLYRLSRSPHADRFVLKGAMLFQLWSRQPYRPTRDLDLLGHGDSSIVALEHVFREVCRQPIDDDDALEFPPETVRAQRIKEDQRYEGVRLYLLAFLDRARIPIQVDVGFGDAVTPGPESIEYPTLLDFPAPRLTAYNRESVIAEKYQAMVMLGMANSRMKDFYDLCALATLFKYRGTSLNQAIKATFLTRRTDLPQGVPTALSPQFIEDPVKQTQWRAFLRKSGLSDGPDTLAKVADVLRGFLIRPTEYVRLNEPFEYRWPPGGPWVPMN